MQNAKTNAIRTQIAALVEEYAAIALAADPFMPGITTIPPSGKVLDSTELKYMVEASLLSLIHI